MESALLRFDFKRTMDDEAVGFCKRYKNFILFVAKNHGGSTWMACIQFGNNVVMIPNTVDEFWLMEFDRQN